MAGDWIKFRMDLLTDPKFLALADELTYGRDREGGGTVLSEIADVLRDDVTLNVTRVVSHSVTLASLMRCWCAVNRHCEASGNDAVWHGARLFLLDDLVGFAGFGEALKDVGWVVVDDERNALVFKDFLKYNTPSCVRHDAMTGAERTKRWREGRKHGDKSNSLPVTGGDVTVTLIESKRRPKDKTPPSPPAGGSVISLGSDPGGPTGTARGIEAVRGELRQMEAESESEIDLSPTPQRPLSARNPPIYSADPVGGREGSESELPISNRRRFGGKVGKALTESIYRAYPRHVGRGAALKSIERALETIADRPGAPADPGAWLLGRVTEYAKSEAGRAGTFTPHPATWFRRGSYDDDPAEWKRAGDDKVATKARESEAAKKAADFARVQAERQRASAEAARAASNVMSPEEKAAWFDKAKAAIGAKQ